MTKYNLLRPVAIVAVAAVTVTSLCHLRNPSVTGSMFQTFKRSCLLMCVSSRSFPFPKECVFEGKNISHKYLQNIRREDTTEDALS